MYPLLLGFLFAFLPLGEDRQSGFIIPTIGENNNRGFFLSKWWVLPSPLRLCRPYPSWRLLQQW